MYTNHQNFEAFDFHLKKKAWNKNIGYQGVAIRGCEVHVHLRMPFCSHLLRFAANTAILNPGTSREHLRLYLAVVEGYVGPTL